MANFPLLRPDLAAWPNGSPVTPVEMHTISTNIFKTINATDGSTHAPSSQINIGGAGLNVTGPLDASALTATNVTINGGEATFDTSLTVDGATLTVQNAGAIVVTGASDLEIQNGSTLSLGTTVNPTYAAARSARYAAAPVIAGLTDADGNAVATIPFTAWAIQAADAALGPAIYVQGSTVLKAGVLYIPLPRFAANATVVGGAILTRGVNAFPSTAAQFTICRRDVAGTMTDLMSVPAVDAHSSGNWTTTQPTILTVDQNATNGFGANPHFIRCSIPTAAGANGYHILSAYVDVTHTDLRR